MQVEEILPHEEYYRDSRFVAKIPDFSTGKIKNERGDNIYKPLQNGGFKQHRSMHKDKDKKKDLSGKNVLVSKRFYYFGRKAIDLPKELRGLKAGRGHKNRFSKDVIGKFLSFIAKQQKGCSAYPTKWSKGGYSCKSENSCGSS